MPESTWTRGTGNRPFLLSDYDDKQVRTYLKWIKGRTKTRVEVLPQKLTGPTNFGEIYEASVRGVEHALGKQKDAQLSFHLSPGTPAMAAVWIILGKTRFPAELVESAREQGVRTASVPFDLSAEFLPDLLREQDERLKQTATGAPPEAPEFADIIHKSRVMSRLIERARRVAIRSVPVLIEGESGTGKELLARAIHRASPRRDKTFIPVNCGAIPAELIESELFGHKKGSFTGASTDRKGHFKEADGGTLFLDELGELPGPAQVKTTRAARPRRAHPRARRAASDGLRARARACRRASSEPRQDHAAPQGRRSLRSSSAVSAVRSTTTRVTGPCLRTSRTSASSRTRSRCSARCARRGASVPSSSLATR